MNSIRWDRLLNTLVSAVAGALFVGGFFLFGSRPEKPEPPPPPSTPTGEFVVIIVDDSAPSIPQALIIDGPQFRALKLAGKCAVGSMTEEWTKAHGYDRLLTDAGGAPAILILDHDGHLAAKPNRLPTDSKALTALLQKSLISLPPPLAPAASPKVVDRGYTLPAGLDAGQPYVINGGEKRMLGYIPEQIKFGAMPKYGDHNPTFPVSEWYECDRRGLFGSEGWILDQDGLNSCVANGAVGALRRARALAGMSDVQLSPGFLYSLINEGKDKGAYIPDGVEALQRVGTCPFSVVPQKPIYPRQMPPQAKAEAPRFKVADFYRCDTWEETCSALLTGRFIVVYGVQVGTPAGQPGNFGHFDQYGVAGHDRGPGNHCMHADGLHKLPDGRWVLDNVNSWGYQFGPFHNGRCYLDKNHLFANGDQPSVCVVRVPGRDPHDPFDPPAYKQTAALDARFALAP